ncbi:hypothetical protein E0H68_37235 [Rhizobium leguminosarum bv. viciae]|uniref:hypothetical protein n=1 Tax=Rhizobium leguminosarum TaxID=384 RepID=UPI00103EF9B7|nr:hypothetical protein [Rhizobium leguminosarum]TBZ50392.1 hypothetical protein E0H44_06810 [Rhizobium leguminosarum bv. viciae]TCA01166.1 hypothetical protein E0H68_37235 [Rhizobium leguminosarum bv. viciae]
MDIVGSTAFKQSNQAAFKSDEKSSSRVAEPWFSPIAEFYREIERLFSQEWLIYAETTAKKFDWPVGEPPELWKSAGDELLYVKLLSDHREALACLHCWIRSVVVYRAALRSKYPTLDVKSAAWIAGFPITNTEVIFNSSLEYGDGPLSDDDTIFSNLALLHEYYEDRYNVTMRRDFIGPSIDAGFRLCELASPRKFIVAVDLALMLVHALRGSPPELALDELEIRYEGRHQLKGVLGGHGYPVFWIDMARTSALERAEDTLLDQKSRNTDDIKKFCEQFFLEHKGNIIIPYIEGSKDPYFSGVPRHHLTRLKVLDDYWHNEGRRRALERASPDQDGQGVNIEAGEANIAVEEMLKRDKD